MHRIIVIAIPVFALLMALEFIYGLFTARNNYRINDAISSLSQGLLSQVVAVCTQLFQIGLYTMAFEHIALFRNATIWDSWPGWILAVVLYDLCDYWLHRAGHESAILWAAHVVHHQSQCFNLSTALRQESAYAFLGWVFYLPMALVGVPPELYAVSGLVVLVYQFWIHTEHVGKLGWFDRVFSSPSNHRVHHAVNARYLDKNYGAIFVVWDRLFGTFQEECEPCVYGTRTPLNSWNPLWAVVHEYHALFVKSGRALGWRDRLRAFYKAPAWRPGALAAEEQGSLSPDSFAPHTFDPPASPRATAAACVLFVVVLVSCCCFLWYADDMNDAQAVAAALGVATGLWAVGELLTGRNKWTK